MKLMIITCLTLFAFAATGKLAVEIQSKPETGGTKDLNLPLHLDGWEGIDVPLSDSAINKIKPDNFLFRNYRKNGEDLNVYLGYYSSLKKSDSAHLPTICYPAQGWDIVENSVITTSFNNRKRSFSRLKMKKGMMSEVVYFAFMAAGSDTNDLFRLRNVLVKNLLLGKRTDNLLIRFSVPVTDGSTESCRAFTDSIYE